MVFYQMNSGCRMFFLDFVFLGVKLHALLQNKVCNTTLAFILLHRHILKGSCHEDIVFVVHFCASVSLLCTSSPIHKMLLKSYEEVIKQISSKSTNNNTLFGEFCMHSIKTWKGWPNYMYFKFQSMSAFAIRCNRAYFT